MRGILSIVVAVTLAVSSPAGAVQPDEILKDSALELRARNLSRELRCMVCQNQSIDDSDAPLARDLRVLVRERLQAGDTDRQVLDFLVSRYGQFVLLDPPFTWRTVWLWVAPVIVLCSFIWSVIPAVRRRREALSEPVERLSAREEARLNDFLNRRNRQ